VFRSALGVVALGRSRGVGRSLALSLALGLLAGSASVGLLALSGWFIAMSALAGAGLAAGFSFFYPSAGVQALAFGRTGLRYAERFSGHGATLRLDAALKERIFSLAVSSPDDFPHHRRSGDLLHAVTSDAEAAEIAILRVVSPLVTYFGLLIGGSLVLVIVNPLIGAVTAVGGVLAAAVILLPAWMSRWTPGRDLADAESDARQAVIDVHDGIDELVSFDALIGGAARIEHALNQVEFGERRVRRFGAQARCLSIISVAVTTIGVAALASGAFGRDRLSVATAAMTTMIVLGLLQLSDPLSVAAREMGRASAVWQRLVEMLAKGTVEELSCGQCPQVASHLPTGTIAVDDLQVNRGRGEFIDRLSFAVSAGQTVVVQGRSGTGKTSLISVLGGDLEPTQGCARTSGRVFRLPQQPYVFRGTVADNLRLAAPSASAERLEEILILVDLADVLGEEPLLQRVGVGGRPLSGGQARRLNIAQAILARPDIVLADEPTAGLDVKAAREMLLALRMADPWMTLVLALHDQQVDQLSWEPDLTISLDRPTPTFNPIKRNAEWERESHDVTLS
jgi:ATP-binding cassette, subfamily C, bacterial CydC